jgi:hypothetical protein
VRTAAAFVTYDEPRFHDTSPVYVGAARLVTWSSSPRRGMTAVLHLKEIDQYGVHPFKGMSVGPSGQRLRTSVMFPSVEEGRDAGDDVYLGECVLFAWADDSLNGMVVRLLLDSGPDGTAGRHPFDGLRVGRKEGEDLVFSAWALADNSEQPVDPKFVRRRRPFHECSGTQQAHILCRDKRFVRWAEGRLVSLIPDAPTREGLPAPASSPLAFAAEVIRIWCAIPSRSVLSHETPEGERARIRWRVMLEAYDDDLWGRAPPA